MNDLKIQVKYTTTNINGVLTENCTYLDLYEYDIPKITISIEDIISTNLKTPYTNTFRVPNSTTNSAFFRDVFSINGTDFDVTKVVDCYIIVDDNIFTFGELRLNKVYEYEMQGRVDYEVVFIGQLRNLVSRLGDKKINELNWDGWNFILNFDTIVDSWSAYPQNSFTASAGITIGDGEPGDVIFPLIEFGYKYIEEGADTGLVFNDEPLKWMNISLTEEYKSFIQSDPVYPLGLDTFRPMVRAKAIFDKIMNEAGFDYESNFLNSSDFKNLYVSAWGNEAVDKLFSSYYNFSMLRVYALLYQTYNVVDYGFSENVLESGNDVYYYPLFFANNSLFSTTMSPAFITDPSDNFIFDTNASLKGSNDYYKIEQAGSYNVGFICNYDIAVEITTSNQTVINGSFRLKKRDINGVVTTLDQEDVTFQNFQINTEYFVPNFAGIADDLDYNDILISANAGPWRDTINLTYAGILDEGDRLFVEVYINKAAGQISANILWIEVNNQYMVVQSNVSQNLFTLAPLFENDYKQIDFIKDIANKFRLVFDDVKAQPRKLKIEPFSFYVGRNENEIFNWTDKLDLSKVQEIEPIFYSQKKYIDFIDKSEADWLSQEYEDQYDECFSNLEVYKDNDLLLGKREIKTNKFVMTATSQIGGYQSGENVNGDSFLIPLVCEFERGPVGVGNFDHLNPIVPKTHFLYYNGKVDTDGVVWYLERPDSPAGHIGYSNFPMVSLWNKYPVDNNTMWFSWSKVYPFNRSINFEFNTQFTLGQTVYDRYWKNYIDYLYDKESRIYTAYFKLNYYDLFPFNFSNIIQVKSNFYYVNKIENMPLTGDNIVKVELIKLNGFTPPYQIAPPVVGQVWNTTDQVWNTTTNTWED